MAHLYRIAVNSFRESIREPVYFLMLLVALLLIGHYPWMTLFVFFEQLKMVVDSSMATTLLFSLAASVLAASHTVSREMNNGTVLLLLSKPVARWSFVLGKICGIAVAALLFCAVCCCASVISVYIAVDQFRMELHLYGAYIVLLAAGCAVGMLMNYLKGSSFAEYSTCAVAVLTAAMMLYCCKFQPHPELSLFNLAKALFMLNFAVVIMATIAAGTATRFDSVPTMCICTVFFFLGLMSSHLFLRPTGSVVLDTVFSCCYAVIPNWQFFWLTDAIAVKRNIPDAYIWYGVAYSVIYFAISALWAVMMFRNREAAGSTRT